MPIKIGGIFHIDKYKLYLVPLCLPDFLVLCFNFHTYFDAPLPVDF